MKTQKKGDRGTLEKSPNPSHSFVVVMSADVLQLTSQSIGAMSLADAERGQAGPTAGNLEDDIMYQRLAAEARGVYWGADHYEKKMVTTLAKIQEKLRSCEDGYDIEGTPILVYLPPLGNFVFVTKILFNNPNDRALSPPGAWCAAVEADLNYVRVIARSDGLFYVIVDFRRVEPPQWKRAADTQHAAARIREQHVPLSDANVKAVGDYVHRELPRPNKITNECHTTTQPLHLPEPLPPPLGAAPLKKQKRARSEKADGERTHKKQRKGAAVPEMIKAMNAFSDPLTVDKVLHGFDAFYKDPASEEGTVFESAWQIMLGVFSQWVDMRQSEQGSGPVLRALIDAARDINPRLGREITAHVNLETLPPDANEKYMCQMTCHRHASASMRRLTTYTLTKDTKQHFYIHRKKEALVVVLAHAYALSHLTGVLQQEELRNSFIIGLKFMLSVMADGGGDPPK